MTRLEPQHYLDDLGHRREESGLGPYADLGRAAGTMQHGHNVDEVQLDSGNGQDPGGSERHKAALAKPVLFLFGVSLLHGGKI